MRSLRLPCALLVSILAYGCTELAFEDDLADGTSGKSDENAASVETSEPLEVELLQTIACEAVAVNTVFNKESERASLLQDCNGLEFTVTRKLQSTLYQHSSSRLPVTIAMDVTIGSGSNQRLAHLFRIYSLEQQRFVWRGTVPEPIKDDAFISELARTAGPKLDLVESPFRFQVRPAEWDEIPARIARTVDTQIAALENASLGEAPQEITRDGEVIGYIAPVIVGSSTDPLLLYYDRVGTLVESVPAGIVR